MDLWRGVGAFPDGPRALMQVAGRLRHVAGMHCHTRPFMNMEKLKELEGRIEATG